MLINKLKQNPDKAEFLIGMNSSGANILSFPIDIFGVETNPAKCDENLGAIFDKKVTSH